MESRWCRWCRICLIALFGAIGWGTANGQQWPSKPIRWIIPFPAGGPADVTARMVAPKLSERLGQPIIIDNRPGAASNIGYEAAAKAPPDGYTMVLAIAGLVTNPHMYKLNYDPMKDLVAVSPMIVVYIVLVANPRLPANTVPEILALAKSKPGSVKCAWGGSTVLQLACENLRIDGKVDITIVPYKGSAPALNDLLGGQVDLLFDVMSTAGPQVRNGRVKAIATTNSNRGKPPFPDLPTISESIPGFEMTTWQGVLMPAGTPREIVYRMNREIAAVMALPEIRQRVSEMGLDVLSGTPEWFAEQIRQDYAKYGRLIRAANITAE